MTKERIICPSCKRAIRNINAVHYCKEVAIDDLFQKRSDEILLAFDRVLQQVAHLPDVDISATKNCIVFVRNKTFLVVKPMTKYLEVKFYATAAIEDEDLYKCQLWNSKYEGVIRVQHEDELKPRFFEYFEGSYLMS